MANFSQTWLQPFHLSRTYSRSRSKKWSWGPSEVEAFIKVKELLKSSRVLVHFDPQLPLILSCDASPYGLGAVLSHRMPSGEGPWDLYLVRLQLQNGSIHSWTKRPWLVCLVSNGIISMSTVGSLSQN